MVLDVCRSVLGNEADAEDAFQATFLILVRKAASIRKTGSVGSWLHGVAYWTALKARSQLTTRQKNEARAPVRILSEPDDFTWREVRVAAVKSRLHRARLLMRKALALHFQEQAA
jgi:DNA-directed RNA polymerase specialized sigma24 family protein